MRYEIYGHCQRGCASLGRGDCTPGSPALPPPLGEDGAGGKDLGGTQPLPEGVVLMHLHRQRRRAGQLLPARQPRALGQWPWQH